jgi:hypothetical protein
LSSLHKDQVFGEKEPREEELPKAGAVRSDEEPPSPGTYVLKWYFLLVALALTISTLFGLWMGLTHINHKRTCRWLLGVGVVIPVALGFIA